MTELHTERGGELTVLYTGPQSRMPARYEGWLQVFEHWRQHHRRYHDLVNQQGWTWEERPSIGFFAAAAWASGGCAMEEYTVRKKGAHDRRTRYAGRADLWARVGEVTYSVEAKQGEVRVDPTDMRTLVKLMDGSRNDAARVVEESDEAVGLSFAALTVADVEHPRHRAHLKRHASLDLGELLRTHFERGFIVHLFPRWEHDLEGWGDVTYVGHTMLVGIGPQ